MLEIIGSVFIALLVLSISYLTGINTGIEKIKDAERKRKAEELSNAVYLFQPPEYEFKTVMIKGKTLENVIDELNKINNNDNLFMQALATDYFFNEKQSDPEGLVMTALFRTVKQQPKTKPTPPPTRHIRENESEPNNDQK